MGGLNQAQRWVLFLVVVGVFAATAAVSIMIIGGYSTLEPEDAWLKKMAAVLLFTEVAGVVVALFRAIFMSAPAMSVNIRFPVDNPTKVSLKRCEYRVWDVSTPDPCATGDAAISKGIGGWTCKVPVSPNFDTATLTLHEENGSVWRVERFSVFSTTVDAQPKEVAHV